MKKFHHPESYKPCSKIRGLWSRWIKYGTSFCLQNQKAVLKGWTRCFHSANHHWVRTARFKSNEFKRALITLISMVHTGCSSESVRTMENRVTRYYFGMQSINSQNIIVSSIKTIELKSQLCPNKFHHILCLNQNKLSQLLFVSLKTMSLEFGVVFLWPVTIPALNPLPSHKLGPGTELGWFGTNTELGWFETRTEFCWVATLFPSGIVKYLVIWLLFTDLSTNIKRLMNQCPITSEIRISFSTAG